jgi:16S rRNA G1207 methylase RsmC
MLRAYPEMRGTWQIITLSTVPSSNSTLQDAPVTVTNSSNNDTIQNPQQAILALQQVIGSLQQILMGLQQSAPQDGNITIFSDNNNNSTVASSI